MVSFNKFLVKNHLYVICVLIFILMFFLKPIYGTTDDFILDSWLNGTYTGEYESDSIFISSFASNFFSYLYSLTNVLPWYPLVLLVLNLVSIIFIVYQIKKNEKISVNNYIILIITLLYFFIWSFLRITYTSAGIILAIAALISFYYSIKLNDNKMLIISILFSMLAFSVRPESLIAALIFFYPIFIFKFENIKLLIIRSLLLLSSLIIIFGLNRLIENNQPEDFKEYRTWSKQVQSFAGRPTMEIVAKNIGNSGWTTSEYNSFKDLTYFDPQIFNEDWINSGLELTKNYFLNPNLELNNVFNIFENTYKSLSLFLICLLFVAILVFYNFKNNKTIIFLFMLNFLLINFLLGLYFQNVARVSVPILIGIIIFLTLIGNKPIKNNVLITSSIIAISILSFSIFKLNSENIQKISKNLNNSNFIKNKFSQNIILIHGNQEFAQFVNPYSLSKVDQSLNVFMIGNWDTFSPHWYKRANNLGIDGQNLTDELLNNKKLLWTAPSIPDTTFNLKNLLKEQGFGDIDAVRIDSLPDGNDIRALSLKD